MAFVSGARTTQSETAGDILDLEKGLKFLNPAKDGIAFLKKLGFSKKRAKSYKYEWFDTSLRTRRETVTLADGSGTALTVADAYMYKPDDLIRIESEIVRVTAIASATGLTIARAQAGTTGAAHAAKSAVRLGSAREENSQSNSSVTDAATARYNYVQTFDETVEMSTHEIVMAHVEGNPFEGQLKRRFIDVMRDLSAAVLYGVRYADTTNRRYYMGGLKAFVTTNVTNVAGALTTAGIDALIKSIVDAGGRPDTILVGTDQLAKLSALDVNRIQTDIRTKVGGNLRIRTWQSAVLDYDLEVILDFTVNPDELWVLSTDNVEVFPMSNNGAGHGFRLLDATTPGQDGKEKRILGHYTTQVQLEKSHGYLYGLT